MGRTAGDQAFFDIAVGNDLEQFIGCATYREHFAAIWSTEGKQQIMAQGYLPAIKDGDKRIMSSFVYVDGAGLQPSDAEVKKLRVVD